MLPPCDLAYLSWFPVIKCKQDPQVLFISILVSATSVVVAAIEAVMMVVVMVMMVVIIPPISRDHHDRRVVVVIAPTIEAVVVMVMMMMVVELSELNIFARFWRSRFIDRLQQGARVRNRLEQVRV
ncbi:hypothetical protein XH98_08290 [Bradyrhizobium sp. CCBAU 51745]|nr:hypothetical protein [Bradyrhizobium sp. CCBAU 51745]